MTYIGKRINSIISTYFAPNGREIRNIKFLYGGWVYPAEEGYCSVQATSMVGSSGAHAAMTPGHVEVNFAKNIVFSGNTMAHMAVTGINAENGVKENEE